MLAFRNLLRRRIRTLLTVTGVAIGVSIVVALSAIARGFRTQVNDLFSSGRAHLILSRKDAADPILSYLPESLLGELRARDEIAAVEPVVLGATQVPPLAVFIFFGTTRDSPFLEQIRVVEGEGLFATPGTDRVCLGARAARNLGREVGDTLPLGGRELTVVGLFESATPLIDAGALLSLGDAQELAGLEQKITSALVQLRDSNRDALVRAEQELEADYPEIEATPPSEWAAAFDEFDLAEQTATVFTILAICIGGISVMNTMLMSVFERTREIGILQAIGWSRWMVVRQVLAEALLVATVGTPLGIALGVGIVELIGSFQQFSWVAGHYDTTVFLQGIAVGFGMGVVGSIYPAWRAVGITPIEALRYE